MCKRKGPLAKITYTCSGCDYCTSEKYYCQGDSGTDVYCEHPSFEEKKSVGDTSWDTPNFCPHKKDALSALVNEV